MFDLPRWGHLPTYAITARLDRQNGCNTALHNSVGDQPGFSSATQTEMTKNGKDHYTMKNRFVRFIVYSVSMTVILYLAFILFDLKDGTASDQTNENLLLAVTVGVMTSASLVFLTKSHGQPKG